jgi:hypothetical protein
MPTNEFLDEPNDDTPNAQNDMVDGSSVVSPVTSKTRFDPTALAQASEQQLEAIRNELRKEIKPKSFVERIYVDDLAYVIWDIRLLRRIKNSLIRYEMQAALRAILEHVMANSDFLHNSRIQSTAKKLAAGWYWNKKDQDKVEKIFAQFNLDENSIEAEAWRRSSADLDLVERQLAVLETRRDKTLIALANYRDGLAQRLKQKVQRIIEADAPFEANALPETDAPAEYSRLS